MSDETDHKIIDPIHELVGAYSIGALDMADFDLFEQHLQACEECQGDLDEMADAAAIVALSRAETLPADFVDRLLNELPAPVVVPIRPSQRMKGLVFAAAAAVVIVVGIALASLLNDSTLLERIESADDTTSVTLEGEAPSIELVVSIDENGVGFVDQDVAVLGAGSRHALWHLDGDGQPTFLGILRPNGLGQVSQSWDVDPSGASAFALSVEELADDPPTSPSTQVTYVGIVER